MAKKTEAKSATETQRRRVGKQTADYIAGQEEHHRKISFQDEFRGFLKRYEIEFDERYVWD
jgi:hypothetical protein